MKRLYILMSFALLLSCSGQKQGDIHKNMMSDSIAYERWGNPNSPYRDEERYISFLNEFLAGDSLPEAVRLRAEERLRTASLNRKGSIAADFRFIDRDGIKHSLHTTQGKHILMIFYDPECPHCQPVIDLLADDKGINEAIESGRLCVVAIYAEGKRDIWDSTKSSMPTNWIVGYDLTGILDRELYNIPAMPTPYLLDSTYRVLLKDPIPERIMEFFQAEGQRNND